METIFQDTLIKTLLLTVVSTTFHEAAAVGAMLTITPLKAGLVFYYFMHLKFEGPLLKGMLFVALATLVTFIGMLFLDIGIR